MIKHFLFPLVFTFAVAGGLRAQNASARLTLEDLFINHTYGQKGFGPIAWMNSEKAYTAVERSAKNEDELIKYDVESGKRSVLVPATQLRPAGAAKSLRIENYSWSEDNAALLIFTETRRVWRYNTRGDYWVLDLASGRLSKLGKGLDSSSLMFAKFSPDHTKAAYVSHNNLYVEDIATGAVTQLTNDGDQYIINGTFDWVYEEELDCRDGFRWSPDGKNIAFWHSDSRDIGTFYLIDNVDSIYSRPIPLPYPKVGTRLSKVKVGVISATGGEPKWFDVPGDPADNYLARMDFIPGSQEVMIQQLNRPQNRNRVWIGDVSNLKLTNILIDSDRAFLDIHDNIKWLDNNKYFTWTSEKDGWMHLYKVSRNGNDTRLITKGDFDVVQINCIDPASGYVYYIASPQNFTERYLYRSRLDGKGNAEMVTPATEAGQHTYNISPNAKWAIHSYSDAATPPVISLIKLPQHTELKVLEDNHVLRSKYDSLRLRKKEFFRVNIGDEMLDAFMIRPADFDPSKKYPLLFYVYGEPAGSTVQNVWDGGETLWHQYLAQKGYIVVSVDNRGTKTPRGNAWRKSIYGQIGILASSDQNKAAAQILTMFPFIDSSRIGIWGWSGGGQMTLNCMFRYPQMYKTGLAVSFVSDQRLYDATYQERYMGLLKDNREGYFKGSPINFAANLKGKLMIIHGTADDNVHYQSFEMLVDELIKQKKLFQMMSYPMRSHGLYERENTSYHLRATMERFWEQNL